MVIRCIFTWHNNTVSVMVHYSQAKLNKVVYRGQRRDDTEILDESHILLSMNFPNVWSCGGYIDIGTERGLSVPQNWQSFYLEKHHVTLVQSTLVLFVRKQGFRSCSGTNLKDLPIGQGTADLKGLTSAEDKIILKI